MSDGRSEDLKRGFVDALHALALAALKTSLATRSTLEPLGAARVLLDDARSVASEERLRLGFGSPWRIVPAVVEQVQSPLSSIDQGPNA